MHDLAITNREIADLVPATSIREFGRTMPVLMDDRGRLIAGHGRVAVTSLLGLADVPVGD